MELMKKLHALKEGYNQGRFTLEELVETAYRYGNDDIDAELQQKLQAQEDALEASGEVIRDLKDHIGQLHQALEYARQFVKNADTDYIDSTLEFIQP